MDKLGGSMGSEKDFLDYWSNYIEECYGDDSKIVDNAMEIALRAWDLHCGPFAHRTETFCAEWALSEFNERR